MVLRTEKYKSSSGFTYLKLPCMLTVYLSLCRTGVGGAGGERREKGGRREGGTCTQLLKTMTD